MCVGACTEAGVSVADRVELANIRTSMVTPRTSPNAFVAAFEAYCLAPSIEVARARLRDDDYVPARRRASGLEPWFVDSTKPDVSLQPVDGDFNCGIIATARTGQAQRVAEFVAETFPSARAAEPSRISPTTEQVWLAAEPRGGLLSTARGGLPPANATFSFLVVRTGRAS